MPQGFEGRSTDPIEDMRHTLESMLERIAELEKPGGTSRVALAQAGDGGALPPGGFAGWVPRRTSTGDVLWAVDRLGVQPTCTVVLEEGGGSIEWNTDIVGQSREYPVEAVSYTAARQSANDQMMPDPTGWLYDDGRSVDLIYSGTAVGPEGHVSFGWRNSLPTTFDVYLYPHAEDEPPFKISTPLPNNQNISGPWSHYDIAITNDSAFTTTVTLYSMVGSMYQGTRILAGTDDGEPTGLDPTFTLRPGETRAWRVTNSGAWHGATVTVPSQIAGNGGAGPNYYSLASYGDRWYEVNVKGTENCYAFGGGGEVQTLDGADAPRFYNDKPGRMGISRVRASVSSAPAGGPIVLDVKVDGVSIFDDPIEIAAGQTTVLGIPRDFPYPLGYEGTPYDWEKLADWPPGGIVTIEVLAVGSSEPGTNLTVQVWAG